MHAEKDRQIICFATLLITLTNIFTPKACDAAEIIHQPLSALSLLPQNPPIMRLSALHDSSSASLSAYQDPLSAFDFTTPRQDEASPAAGQPQISPFASYRNHLLSAHYFHLIRQDLPPDTILDITTLSRSDLAPFANLPELDSDVSWQDLTQTIFDERYIIWPQSPFPLSSAAIYHWPIKADITINGRNRPYSGSLSLSPLSLETNITLRSDQESDHFALSFISDNFAQTGLVNVIGALNYEDEDYPIAIIMAAAAPTALWGQFRRIDEPDHAPPLNTPQEGIFTNIITPD